MAGLRFDELEQGWECSVCGGRYGASELGRLTDYSNDDVSALKFTCTGYCMDCGAYWNGLIKFLGDDYMDFQPMGSQEQVYFDLTIKEESE